MGLKECILLALTLAITGCQTLDVVKHQEPELGELQEKSVDFWLDPSFVPDSLECIAVYPTEAGDTAVKAEELAQTHSILVSQIAPYNYRDVIVRRDQTSTAIENCRGRVKSTLREVSGTNVAVFSEKKRALEIQLTVEGKEVWHVQHRFVARAGSLPTNPLSLIVGIYEAQLNLSEENVYVHNTKLIRRMVATLPDRSVIENPQITKQSRVDYALLLDAARYDEIVDLLGTQVQLTPSENWMLGRAYLGLNSDELALNQFMETLLYEPNSAKAWLGVGLAKGRLGQLLHAFAAYDKALAIDEQSFVGHFELGVLLHQIDNPESANHLKRAGLLATQSDNLALASRALYAISSQAPAALSNEELNSVF